MFIFHDWGGRSNLGGLFGARLGGLGLGGGKLIAGESGIKGSTAILKESAEELQILESAGVHEGTQHVDGHIQAVADGQDDDEQDNTRNTDTAQGAQQVEYLGHDSCRQTQGQDTAVGEQIGGIADEVVEALQTKHEFGNNVLFFSVRR